MAPMMLVAEPRIKAAVLFCGGYFGSRRLPEVDAYQYSRHVQIPVLMLNGKYDLIFPMHTSQLPFFEHVGTAAGSKIVPFDKTGHIPPLKESVEHADEWLREVLR